MEGIIAVELFFLDYYAMYFVGIFNGFVSQIDVSGVFYTSL